MIKKRKFIYKTKSSKKKKKYLSLWEISERLFSNSHVGGEKQDQ